MTDQTEVPVDLYVAAYDDPNAAQADWDAIKQLAKDDVITVEALVLVSRDMDGKIDVKDNFHTVGVTAGLGAAGGLLIGLIFPPAFLASGVVGAGIGAGVGGLVSHARRRTSRKRSPTRCRPAAPASSRCSTNAGSPRSRRRRPTRTTSTKHEVDKDSAEEAKKAAAGAA